LKVSKKSAPPDRQVSTRAQIERLWGIVAMVQNGESVTAPKLAKRFEVDIRTIRRDIAFLRERMGIEIGYDADSKTFILDTEFTHIPPLELGDMDFLLLSYLQQCIAPYVETDIGRTMNRSFERLFGLLTGTSKWQEFARTVHFRFEMKSTASTHREVKFFNLLYRAIQQNREVQFEYKPQRKEAALRTVEPCLLSMHHGRWYLYGLEPKKKGIVLFAFARIENLETTGRAFIPKPATHDPRSLLRQSFGVAISTDPPADVVLEFEADVVQRLKENEWHPRQKLQDLPGGRARLSIPLSTTIELRPWILSWGPYVKVISPPELANKIADTIRRMAARYS
jgi:proteasome accessory factor B